MWWDNTVHITYDLIWEKKIQHNTTVYYLSCSVHPSFFYFIFTVYLFDPVSPSFMAVMIMKNLFSLLAIKRPSDTREGERERKREGKTERGGLTIALARLHGCFFLRKLREWCVSIFLCVYMWSCESPLMFVYECVREQKEHSADISWIFIHLLMWFHSIHHTHMHTHTHTHTHSHKNRPWMSDTLCSISLSLSVKEFWFYLINLKTHKSRDKLLHRK